MTYKEGLKLTSKIKIFNDNFIKNHLKNYFKKREF